MSFQKRHSGFKKLEDIPIRKMEGANKRHGITKKMAADARKLQEHYKKHPEPIHKR